MGLHLNDIVPLAQIDRQNTRELAKKVWDASNHQSRLISKGTIEEIASHISQDPSTIMSNMVSAGWLETTQDSTSLRVSHQVSEIASASTGSRMSFDEAAAQVKGVRDRLDKAPSEIDGISINSVYLFGSAVRDKNQRSTIGDLDLAVDAKFDERYAGVDREDRWTKLKTAWAPIISNNDDRLSFNSANELTSFTNNFHVMRVWKNPQSDESSLSPASLASIEEQHSQTVATQQRAKQLSQIISGNEVAATSGRNRSKLTLGVLTVENELQASKTPSNKVVRNNNFEV